MITALTTEYITQIWPEKIPALRQHADYELARLENILTIIGNYVSPHSRGFTINNQQPLSTNKFPIERSSVPNQTALKIPQSLLRRGS
jgi:hypothetical protein